MDYPIRPVRGNWFRLHHPLEKVVWIESNKTIVDYIPAEGDKLTVTLQGAYTPYEMENVTIEGNVLKYENNGTLPCGLYDVVINVVLADGKRLRSHQDGIVKVVKTNREASIPDYVEFGIDTYVLDGAVFMYVPGEGGSLEQVQADWGQDDSSEVDYIKNKPTIPTNTSELTNDSGFLTSETDPTVPSWAKQESKPTYTAQEVGALPANTPIPSEVTESTVSGWGFTKNAGNYNKPQGGIPKTDLAQGVQDSLDLADSALQTQSQADWTENDSTKPSFINHKPTIPSAQIQADWNQSDNTKADYIKNKPTIPDTSNCINKSQTVGLVKNDGTIDTNTYLTQHQDVTNKEDKVDVETLDSNNSFTAQVGKYYKVIGAANGITITLTTPSSSTPAKLSNCIFLIDNTSGNGVTFQATSGSVYYSKGWDISPSKVYEVNALFNGTAWYLTQVEMEVQL